MYQNTATGYSTNFLYVVTLISIFLGIFIIISKNPVLSVLFLIGLFSTISVYLILIGLHFIGLSYLLVYVGAVSILFLFILMLINVRISELLTDNKNSIPLAVLTVLFFNYSIYDVLPYGISVYDIINNYTFSIMDSIGVINSHSNNILSSNITSLLLDYLLFINIASVKSKSWDTFLVESSHITSIGNILYTNQLILFVIASLILLLAMVGAIVLTINRTTTTNKIQGN